MLTQVSRRLFVGAAVFPWRLITSPYTLPTVQYSHGVLTSTHRISTRPSQARECQVYTAFTPRRQPPRQTLSSSIQTWLVQCLACKCPAAVLRVCVNPGLLCSNQKDLRWFAGSKRDGRASGVARARPRSVLRKFTAFAPFFPRPLTHPAASPVVVVVLVHAIVDMLRKNAGNLQPFTGRIWTSRTHSTATSGAIIGDLMTPFADCGGTHGHLRGKIDRQLYMWCSAPTPL
jgi:hypothetical protein